MLERSCGAVVYTERDGQRRYVLVKGGYVGAAQGPYGKGRIRAGNGGAGDSGGNLRQHPDRAGFRRVVTYHMPNGNDKRVVYFLARFSQQQAHQNPEEFLKVMELGYHDALHALTFENDRVTLRAAERFLRRKEAQSAQSVQKVQKSV